jgi:hypothetical protein
MVIFLKIECRNEKGTATKKAFMNLEANFAKKWGFDKLSRNEKSFSSIQFI